ncbi:MAG: hypothetical protein RLN89_03410, partial [Parvibaculum sp.]
VADLDQDLRLDKPEPPCDGGHVEPLRRSIARGAASPDGATRARYARVFGKTGQRQRRTTHGVRWLSDIKLEAGLVAFHLVYLLRSIGGLVAASFRLPVPDICPELTMSPDEKEGKR